MNNSKFPIAYILLLCFFISNLNAAHLYKISEKDSLKSKTSETPKLVFASAPILTATGNQMYCSGSSLNIVTSMSIVHDPTELGTEAIYIQISSGYINGQDLLSLSGTHPNVISTWNQSNGKLTLQSPTGGNVSYADLVNAIEAVVFTNNSPNPSGTRTFSITVGQANYLPSNGHYYQFIPSQGITWTSAKTLAGNSTYYGLQGYLATITAMDEAVLAGEQASGTGWIAGTDEETEGVWKWAAGPETGQVFWNGGPNGSTPNFAFWNNSEPNDANNEDYAHITAPGVGIRGSWNDLPVGGSNGDYIPKGYVVEYGGTPGDPILQISTSSTIYIPQITNTIGASRCDSGTLNLSASASGGTVTWYDSPTGGIPLATGNTFTTPNISATTSYYVDAYNNLCPATTRTLVTATVNVIPNVISSTPGTVCDSGSVILQATASVGNIQWFANASGGNAIGSGDTFNTPSISATTIFYAEAVNNGCPSLTRTPVTATVFPVPDVNDEMLPLCENTTIRLHAGISGVGYQWPNGEITEYLDIDAAGIYTVTMTTSDNCSFTKTFSVDEIAIPEISSVTINGRTITINTTIQGNFSYSIDGINYQASNIFTEVASGLHTAYARNNCGVDPQQFIVIFAPKFFSPNNDSFNDFWNVEGMLFYPEAKVSIFDRYGKLIKQLSRSNPIWDGTLNGKTLPATDYWYILKINETIPEVKGHFSLIR